MDVGDDAKVPVCFDQVGPSRIRISPVNILPKSKHGSLNDDGQVVEVVNEDIRPTGSSPTTATAFELRERASRTLPQNLLRCVGLNTELEDGQPWILKVVKILFYGDRVKDNAISQGRGPSHDAPRFFSFTATSDCVSMITDTYILEEFQEHELFMDMDTCPLRLIQLDLHGFGLGD
ncbi:hypothetical protein BGW38_010912 [Lunasporangiospora selenospora]|uniref:Uncharacterized protein n=1 Tax=Lunasporangiospora selenospora TaxID=979761 RepID=A0A9P6G1S7_9FUNG|nr:hypothetical protein BGW38_010912 [Lunasporangiospora selenospora]